MPRTICLAVLFALLAVPAHADCDVKTEAQALNVRILKLRHPARMKQARLARMYRAKMQALIDKRNLEGDAAKTLVEELRARMTKATDTEAREQGNTELAKAVYSPCEICREKPDRAPLWQLRAARIIHRRDQQEIVYRDAVLEVFGVPVAYTPYFSHADPTVKRKSGFLVPNFGSTSDLAVLELDYPVRGVAPAPLNTLGRPPFGTPGTLVGFGTTNRIDSDGGVKRAGSITTASCATSTHSPPKWGAATLPARWRPQCGDPGSSRPRWSCATL